MKHVAVASMGLTTIISNVVAHTAISLDSNTSSAFRASVTLRRYPPSMLFNFVVLIPRSIPDTRSTRSSACTTLLDRTLIIAAVTLSTIGTNPTRTAIPASALGPTVSHRKKLTRNTLSGSDQTRCPSCVTS